MPDYGILSRAHMIVVPIGTVGAAVADTKPVWGLSEIEGEIMKAVLWNGAAVGAGDGTNNRIIRVMKGGPGGTAMHTFTTNGQAIANGVPLAFTRGVATARRFSVTDVVTIESTVTGTGGALTNAHVLLTAVLGMYDTATP